MFYKLFCQISQFSVYKRGLIEILNSRHLRFPIRTPCIHVLSSLFLFRGSNAFRTIWQCGARRRDRDSTRFSPLPPAFFGSGHIDRPTSVSVLQPSQTIPPEKVKKPEENKFILADTVCVVVESSSRLTFGPKGFGKGEEEEEEERETNNRSAGLFLRPPQASLEATASHINALGSVQAGHVCSRGKRRSSPAGIGP